MSERAKVEFTKGADESTYVSKEVDGYLEMLHGAYEEMEKELKALEKKMAEDEGFFGAEQEQLRGLLKQNSEERNKLEENYEQSRSLYEEQISKLSERVAKEQEAKQMLEDEKQQTLSKLVEARHVIEKLKKSADEIPDMEEIKKFYEGQIEDFRGKLASEKEVKEEIENERIGLQEEINEMARVIEDLNKQTTEMRSSGDVEEFYEEKIKGLEELAIVTKNEIENLQSENEALKEDKKQLEIEQLEKGPEDEAKIYGELFERAVNTAEGYINDTKVQMEELISATKEEQDRLLHRTHVQTFNLARKVKLQADDVLERTQRKRQEVISKTQEEYRKIRELIERASMEYVKITTSIQAAKAENVIGGEIEELESLEKEGIKV